MPSPVLDYFREADPRFKEVSDDELTKYIRDEYPEFRAELGFKNAKSVKSMGATSDTARKRLANLQAEGAAETYEEDISKAHEDFRKEALPAIAATVATAGMGSGALVGKAGWGLFRSLVGNAAARTAAAGAAGAAGMAAAGGSGEEVVESGTAQAKQQFFGELTGGAIHGVGLAAKGLKKFASGSPSGKAFEVQRATDKIARAEEAATELADDFGRPVKEGALTGQVQSFRDTWLNKAQTEVKDAYRSVANALQGKRADIRDIADDLLGVEAKWAAWRGKAGLKGLTQPDPEWTKLVEDMGKGQRGRTYTINRPASSVLDASGQPVTAAQTITKTGVKFPNARENAAALVTARSAAQQALKEIRATGNAPRELEEGLTSLLKKIDAKIPQVDASAGKAMDIAKTAYSGNQLIVERALYKAMKNSGDQVAGHIMDGRFPNNARDFISMANKVGGSEGKQMIAQMRRKIFDELITSQKGGETILDLAKADGKLVEMGENAKIIFGKKADALKNLSELSKTTREALKVAKVKGGDAQKIWEHILQAGLLHKSMGALIGAATGYYSTGGGRTGAIVGMLGGLAGMKYLPPLIIRISENPAATRTMAKALEIYDKDPRRMALLSSAALRMVYSKEELKAFGREVAQASGMAGQPQPEQK